MESEGFAIYDAMMQIKNEVGAVCIAFLSFFAHKVSSIILDAFCDQLAE